MDNRSITSKENGKLGGRPIELLEFEQIPNENWRPIPNWDNYFVSDKGRVLSTKQTKPKIKAQTKRKYKKCKTERINYLIQLSSNNKTKTYFVHRLVLEAFVGPCPVGCEASHLDGDSSNNNLENLKWETHKENMDRKKKHGTNLTGSKNPFSVLNEEKVKQIKKLLKNGHGVGEVSMIYGVSFSAIQHIKSGYSWKHVK